MTLFDQAWFIAKRKRKFPHADMTQTRFDLICDNSDCPFSRLNLTTMSAHGAPYWSQCLECENVMILRNSQ